ncbi:Mis12 protein-domain-containing protein [Chaetomium strumarium]|uniref:Mis12 protein-domain-containing protein n=1 Tax=Chaetomium strumarium TaxID=1170767 RepID=A0AAJ0GL70_9PEZI|nr:Mis12 protein-domain-containing protein [Chaetomium strumarium]
MASRSDTELLTEHFGYPPVSLLDEIINAINFLAERALHSIEQGLLNAPPASLGFRPSKYRSNGSTSNTTDQNNNNSNNGDHHRGGEDEDDDDPARRHRDEVESGTHQLETLLWASIDKNFDRFEIYVMRNILCLRPVEMQWIRLGHYEGLDFAPFFSSTVEQNDGVGGGGEEEEGNAPPGARVESVNRLRRKLQASQRLHGMLVAERARNAALLGEMRRLIGGAVPGVKSETGSSLASSSGGQQQQQGGREEQQSQTKPPLRFLHEKGHLAEGDAETPLTTTTAFTLSQLQSLRALSAVLRAAMPGLAAAGGEEVDEEREGSDKGGKKSWRRERLEYVEMATRKHLENVRGLELGKNGEVRDGEWDGGGRNLAKGEVESLERVVSILGGSRDEQGRMDES